ncbi:hypothetical protein AB0D49_03650 [Streptomyces sp. NPDC048290]|uniref:hypothetical protein n=1 Tax=Streptomyces sp. NPDC048290 TaxID=3155811 RepID=UPI0034459867
MNVRRALPSLRLPPLRLPPLRLLCVPLLGALLTGCGIRATEVPTDFGPAPSRAHCSVTGDDITSRTPLGLPAQVFLLCGSSLVALDRLVELVPESGAAARRVQVAQGLLDQLAEEPSDTEKEAGYTTDVRRGLTVTGPRGDEPDDTLRLSVAPTDLTTYALAQIVCTFSDSEAAEGDGSVILGGPDGTPLRRYDCTDEVRTDPGAQAPPSEDVTSG